MSNWTHSSALLVCALVAIASGDSKKNVSSSSYNVTTAAGLEALRNLARNVTLANWKPWEARLHRNVSASEQLIYGEPILSAMTNLVVMNLTEEAKKGRQWIYDRMNFSLITERVRTVKVVNEYMGSLLSLYALTKDALFLNKSKEIADFLNANFYHKGFLAQEIEPLRQVKVLSTLEISSMGGGTVEYGYLNSLNQRVPDRAKEMLLVALDYSREKSKGLFPVSVNGYSWIDLTEFLTLQSGQSIFFTSLLHRYNMKAAGDSEAERIRYFKTFLEVMDSARKNRLLDVSKAGNVFVRDKNFKLKSGKQSFHEPMMMLEGCVHGGNLLLAGKVLKELEAANAYSGVHNFTWANCSSDYTELGERLIETCHLASNKTVTKLPPNHIFFSDDEEADNKRFAFQGYKFDSGVAQSYFLGWRLTRKQKYREYAAELLQAIEKHTAVSPKEGGGYAPIVNVQKVPTQRPGFKQRFIDHFHATLKYLFLTFSEDENPVLPLDKWVFNVLGHPIPVNSKS